MELKHVGSVNESLGKTEIYISDCEQYLVTKVEGFTKDMKRRPICWLSIKDNGPCLHDWRKLQEIKNILCGKEKEGVEIYPPESQLVDFTDTYHLWVFLDEYRMPFGMRGERLVADPRLKRTDLKFLSADPCKLAISTEVLLVRQRHFDELPADARAQDAVAVLFPAQPRCLVTSSEHRRERQEENRKRNKRRR